MAKPGKTQIKEALSGLRTINDLGPQYGIQFTFAPSLAILASKIDTLGVDIRSFREPLHKSVKDVMVPSIKKNFSAGGRPKWVPLSSYTLKIKKQGNFPSDPLVRSGLLRRTSAQINIWTINEKSATIRDLPEGIWYGKVHQAGHAGSGSRTKSLASIQAAQRKAMRTGKAISGGGRQAPTIPARPMFIIQPADEKAIQKVFQKWLEERVDRHWSRL